MELRSYLCLGMMECNVFNSKSISNKVDCLPYTKVKGEKQLFVSVLRGAILAAIELPY